MYKRIEKNEALSIYDSTPLAELGAQADRLRRELLPGSAVTFLIDRNINYTNVCNSDCSFCGFYRHDSKHPEAYVNSREVIGKKIEEALKLGATRILFQGGHNDELKYDYYTSIVEWIHNSYPEIEINAFSPSEVHQMSLVSGLKYSQILSDLKQAGLRGLPGGGAEILDDEIRKRVSPKKISAAIWIEVMEEDHALDLTTSATMVIGFGEELRHRINHLEALRSLQDRSYKKGLRGFDSFISWTLQHNQNTSLGRSRHSGNYGAGASEYLRHVAFSRLYLDNILHHQASWPTLGVDVASIALHFGCDDFGSTMIEENVVSKAGALTEKKWAMSPDEIIAAIKKAGFTPAQRDSAYVVRNIG